MSSVGLAVLASQLPSPRATLGSLSGSGSATDGDVADAAMLTVASVAVWLLLVWVLLISTVALVGRFPGTVGSAARAALVALAPVAVRNVLLTVVGASVVSGLAGCATVGAGPDSVSPGPAGGAAGTSASVMATTAPAAQLRAERLVGIATLRISDRIAVEGSAVRSVGPEPAAGGPVAGGRATDGPTSSGATSGGPATPSLDWPATAAGSAPSGPSASSAPAVSVDWPGPAAHGARAADRSVVVLRGDSLWSIAARSLPAGADDATVDRTWRAWYAANTPVIGSDPDHLLPGQILVPPTLETGNS